MSEKIYLSLIKPTGTPTLGNYLGALKYWAEPQNEFNCLYGVADLHAITVRVEPQDLYNQTLSIYAMLLAVGIDPEKSTLFIQSHVPAHAELGWLLNCYTAYGELGRMTQFKDKMAKNEVNISAGLFNYPVLMAADILLYNADFVPVGEDQKQHVELCRTIADRVNHFNGDVFKVPEAYIPKTGARIKSLKNPMLKMSKSDGDDMGCISMLDDKDTIIKKFKRATTDSEAIVRYAEGKDGINNLMTIYSAMTGKAFAEIEREFDGRGYGDFKMTVGEAVANGLKPVITKYNGFMADKAGLKALIDIGDQKARERAEVTVRRVRETLGFVM